MSKERYALTLRGYTAREEDQQLANFYSTPDLGATSDLQSLLEVYVDAIPEGQGSDGVDTGPLRTIPQVPLQVLVCQMLNDHTSSHDTQGRARHDWNIGYEVRRFNHMQGTVYVALSGWSDDHRQEWPQYTPFTKAQLSSCFSIWHWSTDEASDLPHTSVVPIKILYDSTEQHSWSNSTVRCWLPGDDLPTGRARARGLALICLRSKILLVPISELLEGSVDGGPILDDVMHNESIRNEKPKGHFLLTCTFTARPACQQWIDRYTVEKDVEEVIVQKIRDALLDEDQELTIQWGEEFDGIISLPEQPTLTPQNEPLKELRHCSVCEFTVTANNLSQLRDHVEKNHPEVYNQWSFVCDICSKRFEQRNGLNRHKGNVHKKQVAKPSKDEKENMDIEQHEEVDQESRDALLDDHQEPETLSSTAQVRPKRKWADLKCPVCEFTVIANNVSRLRDHVEKNHPEVYNQWSFVCDICSKRFEQRNGLNRHKGKAHKRKAAGQEERTVH